MQTHGNHSYVYSGQSALLRSEEKVGICRRNSSPLTLNIYLSTPYPSLTPSPPNICDVHCAGVRGDGVRPGQPRGRGAGLGRGGGLVPGQLGGTVGGLREI